MKGGFWILGEKKGFRLFLVSSDPNWERGVIYKSTPNPLTFISSTLLT